MAELTPEAIAAIQKIIESANSFTEEGMLDEGLLAGLLKVTAFPKIRKSQQKEIENLGGNISLDQLDAAGNINFRNKKEGIGSTLIEKLKKAFLDK
jgi:hypothetical protein